MYLDVLIPRTPATDFRLRGLLARDARKRLRLALAAWSRLPGAERRGLAAVRRLATAILEEATANGRRRFLSRGETRTWIRGVESALSLARCARAADANPSDAQARSALVTRVADLGLLAGIAPRGRLPRDFPRRALGAAGRLLAWHVEQFPLVALADVPEPCRRGSFTVRFGAEPDLGRTDAELWPAGTAWTFVRAPGAPAALELRLGARSLIVGKVRAPYPEPVENARPRVGGVLASGATRIEVTGRSPRFERNVGRALDLLEQVWPEGASIVTLRTHRVVPVREPGLVSFSSAMLPGIVYVNVESSPLVRLAEDLLHEATHMRIHEIEALHPLIDRRACAAGGPDLGDGEGPRFYSPWRREWRPLRGIFHGACTFTAGARWFERLLAASGPGGAVRLSPARRRWVARRLLEEMENVRLARRVLDRDSKGGGLTPAGRRLARAVAREHDALRPAARHARRCLGADRAGRRELALLADHVERLRSRPVRWNWS